MDSDSPITKADLENLRMSLEESFERILRRQMDKKRTYTAREYADLMGIPYSTVVSHCSKGVIKARQNRPGGCWIIEADNIQ
ncbi:hypothetical protein JMN32_05435 [Fulvivirga sp. 29W222]|uniref:Helix-turn-helix domain-containing protein n=1 Tax=Fulvivirga marina TaxID=2494733 RepID=A0A937KAN1_9BACT|nr:hypothetical protein [Fulvivirga marina]MBL6445741.1 hypothetical protein [Fulvivirga marina]